ncbi:hypothetical protein [Aeromonas sp. MdU4]|uniref:hypothetical protein n=1 Tax=Aeromonas sp. MdU4 TaxID=3342819 RepID=UPI0035B81311
MSITQDVAACLDWLAHRLPSLTDIDEATFTHRKEWKEMPPHRESAGYRPHHNGVGHGMEERVLPQFGTLWQQQSPPSGLATR